MKNQQWKIFPCYALGLAVMGLTAWAVPEWFGLIPNPDENTWGIGIGIAVVVIIILSEGDIMDGLDFGGEGKKKKAKNKK